MKCASDFFNFNNEVNELKTITSKNGYPKYFIDSYVKGFLNKLFIPRLSVCTVNKKEILLVLPYLGKGSLETRTKLAKIVSSPTLRAVIFAEQIFAVGRSKNCEFRGINFRDWVIYCEFRGIYFRDGQIQMVTEGVIRLMFCTLSHERFNQGKWLMKAF